MKQLIASTLTITLGLAVASGAQGASRTLSYTYNDLGLVTSVDGPRTDVPDITRYQYDAQGNRTAIINALGQVTAIPEYDGAGRPLLLIDPNGLATRMRYDARGRLIEQDVGGQVTRFGYDAAGNMTQITQPDGSTLALQYDAADRLVGMEDARGNRIEYTLDAAGNRLEENVFDQNGQLARTRRQVFDGLSRLIEAIGADGQRTAYRYDAGGNRIGSTDALGRDTDHAFDALDRLTRSLDPLGGKVSYTYDARDNLTAVTDPDGNTTTYEYDGLGNLIARHSPDTGTTTYTHDAAGNVLTQTDAKGQTTSYAYDALNRLIRATYADDVQGCTNVAGAGCAGATGTVVTYTYDTAPNGIGRLASITDSSGRTAFEYDLHGRTTARHQTIEVDGAERHLTTRYQYNSAGQLTGLTYPSGLQVGYGYTDGQITRVSVNGETLLSGATYEPFGPVSGWTWGNGRQAVRGYDLDGRLITQSLGPDQRELAYDPVGNITAINDAVTDSVFAYDALDRLSSANDPDYQLSWTYDANGNRLQRSDGLNGLTTDYTIDSSSNRLLAADEGGTLSPYEYDANGNTLFDGEYLYTYNAQNRLVQVDNAKGCAGSEDGACIGEVDGDTANYLYNALGQRVYKMGRALAGDANGDGRITPADVKLVNGKDGQPVDCEGPAKGKSQGKGKGQQVACVANQIGAFANQGKAAEKGKGRWADAPMGSRKLLFAYESWKLLGEYALNGHPEQETIWLGSVPVATVQDGKLYYVHADHLGTPRVITEPGTNTIVWRWDADPFGTSEANEDPDGDGLKLSYNLRFPGQYFDAETGKHYNHFRDYDPNISRYVESDPIGLEGGLNTYLYVKGNPITAIDPRGLLKWSGSFDLKGLGVGKGGGTRGEFDLVSECDIDGNQATVRVIGYSGSLGIGAPLSHPLIFRRQKRLGITRGAPESFRQMLP